MVLVAEALFPRSDSIVLLADTPDGADTTSFDATVLLFDDVLPLLLYAELELELELLASAAGSLLEMGGVEIDGWLSVAGGVGGAVESLAVLAHDDVAPGYSRSNDRTADKKMKVTKYDIIIVHGWGKDIQSLIREWRVNR